MRGSSVLTVCRLAAIGIFVCSALSCAAPPQKPPSLNQVTGRIWRVTKAPSQPPLGAIYVFLSNGTLLETSCVETYRIATWKIDQQAPLVLRVIEDGRPAFTAAMTQSSDTTLRFQKKLLRSNETQEISLTAVDKEFVCPDLPR